MRSAPASDAISGSFTPFWSETTKPSGPSLGTISRSAASVCCDFTASSTAPSPSGSSSGATAGAGTENSSTGPSIARPCSFIAATCSRSASQKSTEWPSRTIRAPTVPPIAPAPTTM